MAGERQLPGGAEGQLGDLFEQAGLTDVEGTELAVTVTHPTFEEWWEPYLHGVGPVGEAIAALDPVRVAQVRAAVETGSATVRSTSRPSRSRHEGGPRLTMAGRVVRHDPTGYAVPIMMRSLLLRCRSEA